MEFPSAVADAMSRIEKTLENEHRHILEVAAQHSAELAEKRAQLAEERRQFEACQAELEQQHRDKVAALDAERRSFEEERERMAHGTNPGDIITLNLGGERHVDVKRSTLCQFEESVLAAMFSGRWDGNLDRDQLGRVLIDFNPQLVMPLIDYLRIKKISGADQPVPSPMPHKDLKSDFQSMLKYFGLVEHIPGYNAPDSGVAPVSSQAIKVVATKSAVVACLQIEAEGKPEGVPLATVCAKLAPKPESEVRAVLDKLVEDGEAYTTLDDFTYLLI